MIDTVSCLTNLVNHAKSEKKWLVMLTPHGILKNCRGLLPFYKQQGDLLSGRTLRFENGGLVTIAEYSDPVCVPKKQDFFVMLLGLEETNSNYYIKDIHRWMKESMGVITPYHKV